MAAEYRHNNQECPACGGQNISVFMKIERMPVFCNVLWPSRKQALDAPRRDIQLAFCRDCGLIYNCQFDSKLVEYSPDYENSLYFSHVFRQYAAEVADYLFEKYQLEGKHILEIGCGQGDFLNLLLKKGAAKATGYDPGFDSDISCNTNRLRIFPNYFGPESPETAADIYVCRQVLEHIDQPLDFLNMIKKTMAFRSIETLFVEVPNALFTFRDMGIWDIIYEHFSYFCQESLKNLFLQAGFKPLQVIERYNRQFITLEANLAGPKPLSDGKMVKTGSLEALIEQFPRLYREKVLRWSKILAQLRSAGKKTVIWGAGSKGVTFLNVLGATYEWMPYAVDLNPRKNNRFIPGTAQQVIDTSQLWDYDADVIIIMNAVYKEEIEMEVQRRHANPDILVMD